jgi:hypothetical protein
MRKSTVNTARRVQLGLKKMRKKDWIRPRRKEAQGTPGR